MNVLGIIPARKNSKGVINKNIKLIRGKPLIYYTIREAKKSKKITDLMISSDSKVIEKISKKYKLNNFKIRPSKLATDTSTIDKTIKYELKRMEKLKKKKYDLVILLQPTSPIRKKNIIDDSLKYFLNAGKKYDSLISVSKFEEPNPFKVFTLKKKKLIKLINYKTKSDTMRRQDYPDVFIPNGMIYIFKRSFILKSKKILGKNILGYNVIHEYLNIDTNRDFLIGEKIIR